MADIRIKDLTTTASSTASDDFIAVDGTTNGTRKLNAFSPTFGGNVVVTGTLTSQSTLSTSAGLSCANATITQGYAILTGYGASADAGNLFLGQSSNGNFLNSSLTKIYTAIGGAEISNNVAAGFRVVTTTASTTTSTGALVVGNGTSGGLGVGGAGNFGGAVGVGGATVASRLHVYESTSGTGDSNGITIEQASTADAALQFLLTGTQRWTVGIDNSDSDKFKIGTGAIGSADRLTIDTSGNLSIPATTASTSTSSGALVVSGGVGVAGSINTDGTLRFNANSSLPGTGSLGISSTYGLNFYASTGSSYDFTVFSAAGQSILLVPTGTRNVSFSGTLTTVGNITSGAAITTSAPVGGAGLWELGVYSSTAPSATGYVTIEIGGTVYKLLASNV